MCSYHGLLLGVGADQVDHTARRSARCDRGALNQIFWSGHGPHFPLSHEPSSQLSRGVCLGSQGAPPRPAPQGIVFNRLPPSVRGSPAPSTVATSVTRAARAARIAQQQQQDAVRAGLASRPQAL